MISQVEGQLEMLMGFLGISAEQFLAAMAKATAPNSEHKVRELVITYQC